jgi:hypothetical protein
LNLDDELGLAKALLETEVFLLETLDLSAGLWERFAAGFPGAQPINAFGVAYLSPIGEEGGVDPLPS